MNKFKEQLRIIEEALLKPMSDERLHEVENEKIKVLVDEIKKHAILNSDGTYDVDREIDLSYMNLTELPMQFGKVNGDFDCSHNILTSLKNAPIEVSETFNCSSNELTTLKGSPNIVGDIFYCVQNKLTSLEGAPKEVYGNFSCYVNKVKFTTADVKSICNVKGKIYV